MRICSFLASATEIVCALSLENELVGISHECDYPAEITHLPVVVRPRIDDSRSSREIDAQVRATAGADLYEIDETRLAALAPDLLITQELCAVCAVTAESVARAVSGLPGPARVVELSPHSLADLLSDIRRVGEICGAADRAETVASSLGARLKRVGESAGRAVAREGRPSVLFLEWVDPPFLAGHWLPEMIRLAGGRPLLATEGAPARTMSWAEVAQSGAEVLVISACGFVADRTLRELRDLLARDEDARAALECLPAARAGRLFVADGRQLFSRSGPRLVDGAEYLLWALHPESADAPPDWAMRQMSSAVFRSPATEGRR